MDLNSFAVFGMMRKRMGWLTDRQTVLSQNIANSDTPNYQAKDLADQDFKRVLEKFGVGNKTGRIAQASASGGAAAPAAASGATLKLAATNPAHIKIAAPESRARAIGPKGGAEQAPGGNDVSVEDQVSKMTETQMDYQMTTNLYRKHLAMVKSVLRR